MWIILMGIEHENIHIETSSVFQRTRYHIQLEDEIFEYYVNEFSSSYPKMRLVDVKGATVIIQKDRKKSYLLWLG